MEDLTLKQKVDLLFSQKEEENQPKKKTLKLIRKAKVRKGKLKKSWVGILKIDENRNISGEKQQVEGATYRLNNGTYHTLKGDEIFFWQGKFPVVIQPTWRDNPLSFTHEGLVKNETHGQKYLMARMMADTIKVKSRGGGIIVWIVIGIAVLVGINYFMNGGI